LRQGEDPASDLCQISISLLFLNSIPQVLVLFKKRAG
jgi:hypothetical protein